MANSTYQAYLLHICYAYWPHICNAVYNRISPIGTGYWHAFFHTIHFHSRKPFLLETGGYKLWIIPTCRDSQSKNFVPPFDIMGDHAREINVALSNLGFDQNSVTKLLFLPS